MSEQTYFTQAEAQALFTQANEAYSRQDAAAASEGYAKLLAHGFGGADVLYNLGTAQLAQGNLGAAVLAFERARREGGPAEDIEANLALARAQQLDKVVGARSDDPFPVRVVLATDAQAVSLILLAAWLLGSALLFSRRFVRGPRRLWLAAAAALWLAVALPAGLLLAAHVWVAQEVRDAVVIVPSLPARDLPQDAAKVAFEVHAGLKVRVLDEAGPYVKIRLPNGLEGWASRGGVEEIDSGRARGEL